MRRRAFSLLEMLIVVAVIVLLASVILSVFSAAKAKAETTSCQGRLHQISVALMLYRTDNEGHGFSYRHGSNSYKPSFSYWTPISSYLSSAEVVWCPDPPALDTEPTNLYFYRTWSRDESPTAHYPFEEEVESVVAYCANHTSSKLDPRSHTSPALRVGKYPFVREDGSASTASNKQMEVWYYDAEWNWTQAFKAPMRTLLRFPNEPWPPKPDLAG